MSAPTPRSGGSLVDQAVQHVRAFIRDQDLKVGDVLPGEAHFATALGVSRAVMREAFGALAALRLIDVGNGRRARVGAIDGAVMAASLDHAVATAQVSLVQVWDVRRVLEFRTAELAAHHRTAEQAALIVGEAAAMANAHGDLDRLMVHDIRFHQAIATASGNPLFQAIIRSFEPLMRTAVPVAWRTRTTDAQRLQMLGQHRALADAIVDRNVAAAHAALNEHFSMTITSLLREQEVATGSERLLLQ